MSILEKMKTALPEKSDAFLITDRYSRFYVTGMRSSAGVAVITKDFVRLLIDFRYYDMASIRSGEWEAVLLTSEGEQLKTMLEDAGIRRVFIETDTVTVADAKRYRSALAPVEVSEEDVLSKHLAELRKVKSTVEQACIQRSQDIVDQAFAHILGQIKEGMTETEIAWELESFVKKSGATEMSFETIALSGENSCLPHGVPGNRKVQKGDFVLMDFGAVVDGYCSDMTRTVAVGGISDEQKKVYGTVLEAQKRGLFAIREGVLCGDADAAARKYIEEEVGYKGRFGHSLGHGVGLQIHEEPRLAPNRNEALQIGQVVTVEPGIYLSGRFGVRIEDMVCVTKDGCYNFTRSPKELIVL